MRCFRCLPAILFILITLVTFRSSAQDCPANAGFEDGTLNNWQCYIGSVKGGVLTLDQSGPTAGRHTLLKNTSPQAKDVYGHFPVNCPNGSGYSVMLGNSSAGAQAERISYTISIPPDQQFYTVIYYYAVVFENPNHPFDQQPKFTADVFDVTANKYADCGSFEFVASSGLDGFQKSDIGNDVFYKPWAPITVNLLGYAGKTIRLEFTTSDCTQGQHFGYAYIDVDENCKNPIKGSNYCLGSSSVTLTAPAGFMSYRWLTADQSTELGHNHTLTVSPPPPDGTTYALQITPFPGLGCPATLTTTVHPIDETYVLKVQKSIQACDADGADITQANLTAGSSTGLKYEYFEDPDGQNYLSDPKRVMTSGYYYIRGTNAAGCTDIQPIEVQLIPTPRLSIQAPLSVCSPATVNITDKQWLQTYDPSWKLSYWTDAAGTKTVINPTHIAQSGTYYIRAENDLGCSDIKPISVIVGQIPKINARNLTVCPPANLTDAAVTTGSDAGLTYTYWLDAAATQPVNTPSAITQSGTYFIKGTNATNCESVEPVTVNLLAVPQLSVNAPLPVRYPATINLSSCFKAAANNTYTYWKDAAATQALGSYLAVQESGTYYIMAANTAGCSIIAPVHVTVNPPLVPEVIAPNAFSPNGDGVNDLFTPQITGDLKITRFCVYNRWGQLIYESKEDKMQWDGRYNGTVQAAGTYYWVLNYADTYQHKDVVKSGYVAIVR